MMAWDVPSSLPGPLVVVPFGVTQIDDESVKPEMRESTLLIGPPVIVPFDETQIDDEWIKREMREGTLLINLTDRESGKLVWQGWASQIVDLNRMREEEWTRDPDKMYLRYRKRNIEKAVAKILNDYPPVGSDRSQ
jgi:hypothetical protein